MKRTTLVLVLALLIPAAATAYQTDIDGNTLQYELPHWISTHTINSVQHHRTYATNTTRYDMDGNTLRYPVPSWMPYPGQCDNGNTQYRTYYDDTVCVRRLRGDNRKRNKIGTHQ